ncbi:MAG: leucine-rich repeat protein [Firmicutes bacterium]|nr:leucine-rich repeat protein [Bacillota bacterium]
MRKFTSFILILSLIFACTAVPVQSGVDSLSSAEGMSAYYDDDGIIRLISFEIGGLPEGLSYSVGGSRFDVVSELVSGCVFEYLPADTCVVSGNSVSVKLSCGSEEKTISVPAVKIVGGSKDDWEVSADGHVIERYFGSESIITVPNFIDGKPIISVGAGAGLGNLLKGSSSKINGAVISEGITAVNYGTFANVTSLSSVILPDSLKSIGDGAFYNTGLSQTMHFPASLREIGDQAFRKSGITDIEFSDGLERIGQLAFYQCSKLKGGLKLPDTLKVIDYGAFAYCSGLTGELKLPASLTEIGESCFHSCAGFTGDLVIPGGVKSVPKLAFCCCTGFNGKLVLSEGVEEIGYVAFGGSNSSNAPKFTSIEFPSTLKHIGLYCFQYSNAVKHLELNEGLEMISDGAFDHMTGLEDTVIVIPSTVKTIGGDYGTEENTGCGDHVFYDMGKDAYFTAFEVVEGNKYFTAKDGVLYSADMTRMVAYPRGKTDSRFVIPDTVTQIDLLSFSRPAYLKTIVLPDNYIISEAVPANSLNTDGNNFSVALYAYNNVEAVEVNETNPNYTSVDGVLYSKDMKSVRFIPQAAQGEVTIADGCERIEKGAVYIADVNRVKWEKLILPDSLDYVDIDVRTMLNETMNTARTNKVSDRVVYGGDMYIIYLKGDADLSGEVDHVDVKAVLSGSANGDTSVFNKYSADVNDDGKVNIVDAVLIMQKIEEEQ